MLDVLRHQVGVLHVHTDSLRHLAHLLARGGQLVGRHQALRIRSGSGTHGKRNSAEEGGKTEHHVLEGIISVGLSKRSQHAVEVGLRVLHDVILVLLHKSAIYRVRYRFVLLCCEDGLHPILSHFVTVKTKCVVLIKVIVRLYEKAEF